MFQNNEVFAFLPSFLSAIGFVSRGAKVTFSGRSVAFGLLSRFTYPNFLFLFILRRNNARIDLTSCFRKSRIPERHVST